MNERNDRGEGGADGPPDEVLYESNRGPRDDPGRERLVVRKRTYQGHPFVDVRLFFRAGEPGSADYRPTQKGISVKMRELADLGRTFTEAAVDGAQRGGGVETIAGKAGA